MLTTASHLATIILAVEILVLGLIPLVMLYFTVRGLRSIRSLAGRYLPIGQCYATKMVRTSDQIGGWIAAPVVRSYVWWTQLTATLQALRRRL